MKIVAVVQARLGSSRLPAKILLDLGGQTALQRCLSRVARIAGVDEVVVATTDRPEDDPVVSMTRRLGFRSVRGSEQDVLSRYELALRETRADAVVRCTSDCPLLDPAISSFVVDTFVRSRGGATPFDYVSNVFERRLPRGLDTEILSAEALERAARNAVAPPEREHVTLHVYSRPEIFRCGGAVPEGLPDTSHHRWTLDTLDDYRFLFAVFERLGEAAGSATMADVLALLERHPELVKINADIVQKSVA